jgi:hypothetical protein
MVGCHPTSAVPLAPTRPANQIERAPDFEGSLCKVISTAEAWVVIISAFYEGRGTPGFWLDTRVRVHTDGRSWNVI